MKKHYSFPAILLIVISLASCQQKKVNTFTESDPSAVNISAERLARIDNVIKQYIDSGWIEGAVGFIARDGKIVYDKAFGKGSVNSERALATDDIFRIASQTKAITSVAVMTLFEQGKFLLDDPVSKYIPEFAHPVVLDKFNEKDTTFTSVPAKRGITIRDLLTHTSGIEYAGIGSPTMRAIYAKYDIPGGFGAAGVRIGDKMKALGKLPLLHNPGEKFTYGLNVDVLGYLVEVWSGETLDQYFHNHIFSPLGMNDTYFYMPAEKADRLVKVITEDGNRKLVDAPDEFSNYPLLSGGTYYSGGAGLSSTVRDYGIFLQMMLNGGEYNGARILAPRTVELMTSNQIGDLFVGKDKFGLGFEITTEAGQTQLGISKGSFSWGGYFGTTYWADPEKKIVGLLFINQSPLRHGDIQGKFKAMVYQAILE
ncbi:MAG TPA: serine hydrolase domain-containing protein [Bacteroidales bacterium]|nr:serine hydrolase domain-containing protein [Bacteroidales bacterium]